jgi:toxin ParE1/3/4
MSEVRISRQADADLDEIWDYVAQRNVQAADRLAKKIAKKYDTLAIFPEMGTAYEELAPRLRGFVVGNYVIYYRPLDDGVEIIRVLHGRRDALRYF